MYLLDYFNKIILFSYLKKGNISFTIFEISLSLLGVARRGIDVTLQGKSILSLENLSVAEIERILQVATQMKNSKGNRLLHYFLKHQQELVVLLNWRLNI